VRDTTLVAVGTGCADVGGPLVLAVSLTEGADDGTCVATTGLEPVGRTDAPSNGEGLEADVPQATRARVTTRNAAVTCRMLSLLDGLAGLPRFIRLFQL
jgi:hypothetical protein